MNITQQLAALQHLTAGELRERYAELAGEKARSNNKAYLIKRVAWLIQSKVEGFGLSQRAQDRAKELGAGSTLRTTPPDVVAELPYHFSNQRFHDLSLNLLIVLS